MQAYAAVWLFLLGAPNGAADAASAARALAFLPLTEDWKGQTPEGTRRNMPTDDHRRAAQIKSDQTLPPPRDPERAVREEFEIARARGSKEALELFIVRHADHPLADEARRELRRINK